MRIYTGTGDDGTTGLFGNRRVAKDHVRIEAYGTIDELNAVLGLLGAEAPPPAIAQHIPTIQRDLFEIGADLATEGGQAASARLERAVQELESWIDASEAALPPLKQFVLPAGSRVGAWLHLARTVTRRAERRYWTLVHSLVGGPADRQVPAVIGVYLNRLSDLCFSWARLANAEAGAGDVPWTRSGG